MSYQSLYRKYRSQTFDDLIGQDHVVRTIQNGIASGRIAHAYLFTGPRGTGKTSTARLLAKALCCEQGPTPTPDNTCAICTSITEGACVDVVEMDAASDAGVEDIREKIVEVVEYQPMVARYRVFIIDEVHDLSNKAFDALLKTIEEPPGHIIFILATTEFNKVPATIRSRCQKYEFHRASMSDLLARLNYVAQQEGIELEPAAASAIGRMADGGYRDALTLLEQAILTSKDGKITLGQVYEQLGLVSDEIVDGILVSVRDGDVAKILGLTEEVARLGRDPRATLESLLHRLADLTRIAYGLDAGASADATHEAALHETAARLGRDRLIALRSMIAEAHKSIRDITLPRVWLDSELIRIAQLLQAPAATATATVPPNAVPRPTPAPAPAATPAPAASAPEPTPTPAKPVPEPVAAKEEPKTNGHAVVATKPGQDPRWAAVVAELTGMSKVMGIRLTDSRFVEQRGEEVVIEFQRAIDADWMQDKPQKISAMTAALAKHFGEGAKPVYTVGKNGNGHRSLQPEAVELPAEGARLHELTKEMFGGDRSV